jgi:hypothetical protein
MKKDEKMKDREEKKKRPYCTWHTSIPGIPGTEIHGTDIDTNIAVVYTVYIYWYLNSQFLEI